MRLGAKLLLVLVIIGIALDWYTSTGYGGALGATYEERNAFAVTGDETAAFRDIGILSFGHVFLTGFAFAALFTRWRHGYSGFFLRGAVILWAVMITVDGLVQGSRITGLLPMTLLIMYGAAMRWPLKRFATRFAVAGAFTLSSAAWR